MWISPQVLSTLYLFAFIVDLRTISSQITCPTTTSPKGKFTTSEQLRGAVRHWLLKPTDAEFCHGHIKDWDVSLIGDMSFMFTNCNMFDVVPYVGDATPKCDLQGRTKEFFFNENIGGWNVSNVTNMNYMFFMAVKFDQNLNKWNTGKVASMKYMFANAQSFNGDITSWDVSKVTSTCGMFYGAKNFNRNISTWKFSTAVIKEMESMFYTASAFDQDLIAWNTDSVTRMNYMFARSKMTSLATIDVTKKICKKATTVTDTKIFSPKTELAMICPANK